MGAITRWRRSSTLLGLASWAAFAVSCGGAAQPPQPPPPKTEIPPPAPPPPKPQVWVALKGAPNELGSAAWALPTGDDELRADHGGMRWLIHADAVAEHASTFDPMLQYVAYDPSVGLVAVEQSGHLLHARNPLDDWHDLGALPDGVKPSSLAVYRGQISIRRRGGVLVGTVEKGLHDVAQMGDRSAYDVRVGADGRGIALFVPQALGLTQDNGKTWTPVDDAGLHIAKLLAKGDSVVLLPGGANDEFARSWKPGAQGLERSLVDVARESGAEPTIKFGRPSSRPRVIGAKRPDDKRERYPWLTDVVEGRTPIWANQIGVVEDGRYANRGLGELADKDDFQTERCVVARCGSVHAFACDRSLRVVRDLHDSDSVETVRLAHRAESVAFAGSSTIVVIGSRGMTWVDTSGVATERKAWIDDKRLSYSDRVVGGCEEPGAGAWVLSPRKMYRFERTEQGLVEQETGRYGDPRRVLGLDEKHRPVFLSYWSREEGEPKLGRFDAAGTWQEISLPFEPREFRTRELATRLGGLREGRGMLFDKDQRPWVTNDGGLNWTLLASPPWASAVGKRGLVCGASRCEIENTAVFVGWEVEQDALPVLDPNASQPAPAVADKSADVEMTCTLGQPVDTGKLVPAELHFGVAGADFTATLMTPFPENPGEENSPTQWDIDSLYVGPKDKHARRQLVRLREPLSVLYGLHPTTNVGDGILAFIPSMRSIPPQRVTWDRGPGTPLIHTTWGQGLLSGSSINIILQSPGGVALVNDLNAEIRWIRVNGKQEVRPWPNQWVQVESGWDAEEYRAWIVERGDSTWLAAIHRQDELELVEIDKDGVARFGSMFTGPGDPLARMIVIGDQAAMIGVEPLADGRSALRARPVTASLTLGEARTLGVIDPKTSRLALPACSADDTGTPVSVSFGKGSAAFGQGKGVEGPFEQQVRVSATTACLAAERVVGESDAAVRRVPGSAAMVIQDKRLYHAACTADRITSP